jgi:MarR family transcriptional regulator for hemolysin
MLICDHDLGKAQSMIGKSAATVAQLVNRAARHLARLGDGRLRPLGLRYAQVPVLALLGKERALTQAALTARVGVEQSSMAQLLARMERDGQVRRSPDPEDARRSLVAVTPATVRVLRTAKTQLDELDREASRGLSPRELATLKTLLGRVLQNLERLDDA